MKIKNLYLLSLVLIIQWGVVSFIGGTTEDGINNSFYYASFILFWIGLVVTISTTFRFFATRKK
jgi:hypothetical protein